MSVYESSRRLTLCSQTGNRNQDGLTVRLVTAVLVVLKRYYRQGADDGVSPLWHDDTAKHTFAACTALQEQRRVLGGQIGPDLSLPIFVALIFASDSSTSKSPPSSAVRLGAGR